MSSNLPYTLPATIAALTAAVSHAEALMSATVDAKVDHLHEALCGIDWSAPYIANGAPLSTLSDNSVGRVAAYLDSASVAGYAAEDAGMCRATQRAHAETMARSVREALRILTAHEG